MKSGQAGNNVNLSATAPPFWLNVTKIVGQARQGLQRVKVSRSLPKVLPKKSDDKRYLSTSDPAMQKVLILRPGLPDENTPKILPRLCGGQHLDQLPSRGWRLYQAAVRDSENCASWVKLRPSGVPCFGQQ